MQKILAAVESLFLFKLDPKTSETFYQNFNYSFPDLGVLKIKGEDASQFLQGQLTNDVLELHDNTFQLTTRIDRSARIVFWGYLLRKTQSEFYFLGLKNQIAQVVLELEKFIISEDVTVEELEEAVTFQNQKFSNKENDFIGIFQGYLGTLSLGSDQATVRDIDLSVTILQGFPLFSDTISGKLIHETLLNYNAISYTKGCFLGQEAATKIENNRGGNKAPALLTISSTETADSNENLCLEEKDVDWANVIEIENVKICFLLASRELRINGLNINFKSNNQIFQANVLTYPTHFFPKNMKEMSEKLYHKASVSLMNKDLDLTEKLILNSISCFETVENLEFYGVLLGRKERFLDAIKVMDKILSKDQLAVMAHTNKSLYFMRLGMIKEAEEEKSLATVCSFEKLGQEAKFKKESDLKEKQIREEVERRKKMFLQVLDIDENDDIANWGLGEIYFKDNDYEKSLNHLEKSIESNSKNFKARLYLIQCQKKLGKLNDYKANLLGLISESAKAGQFQVANEAQLFLSELESSNNSQ